MRRPDIAILLCGLAAVGGCAAEATHDPFTATGEIIALGGGDGGPRNACFTCHGLRGQGDGQLTPRLAGLPNGYLLRQLNDYADGRRADPVMGRIARKLSFEDRLKVADFYADRRAEAPDRAPAPGGPGAVLYQRGDPARDLAPCARCHGLGGEGAGQGSPPLAGQPPAYLAEQLRRWRSGKRRNDPLQVMAKVSRSLTEDEIGQVSAYAAALAPPDPPPTAPPEASPEERRPDR